MMSTTVELNKVKRDVLNKSKDELRKSASKFKSMCSSTNDEHSISNWIILVVFRELIAKLSNISLRLKDSNQSIKIF